MKTLFGRRILNLEELKYLTKEAKKHSGCNEGGEIRCIRVKNTKTKKSILVNSEGYDYPRYTAMEK